MTTQTITRTTQHTIKSESNRKWGLMAFLSILISLYAIAVTISLTDFVPIILPDGLRPSFALRPSAFYLHIGFGAIALSTGAINLNTNFLRRNRGLHKKFGLAYVVSIWISSLSGTYLALYTAVGTIDHIGFVTLGILWFFTTTRAYLLIKQKKVKLHREWIIRSFALTFAAVTLRLWLPILIITGIMLGYSDPFVFAYPIVAYTCWIPNLIFAEWIIRRAPNSKVNKLIQELS